MENKDKHTIFGKFYNGLGVYLITVCITFVLNRVLDYVWLQYAPIVIVGIYILWSLVDIYSSKLKPVFDLSKIELLFYLVVIPIELTMLIGFVCASVVGDPQVSFFDNAKMWIVNNENHLFLVIVFSICVLLCCFIAYRAAEKSYLGNNQKIEESSQKIEESSQKIEESSQKIEESFYKIEEILYKIEKVQTILEKQSWVGYTATCIPIKYNKEHDTFVFALIQNTSHEKSEWMFPGSHIEVSDNQLRESFDLTDINIVPEKVIQDKVKKEAGLIDLQLIDPYYETVSFENTTDGKRRRRYPNTCYPVKAPIFNYLFRVNQFAKCYEDHNHRCHYDFTYIGEYNVVNEAEAKYEIVEIELNRNKNFRDMERTDAIAHIISKLSDQINKKIKSKSGKKSKNQFIMSFDQLCLDSIPEMIYNAILFYIDYKEL